MCRVLVLSNGAYGRRMEEMCTAAGIHFDALRSLEIKPFDLEQVNEYKVLRMIIVTMNLQIALTMNCHLPENYWRYTVRT